MVRHVNAKLFLKAMVLILFSLAYSSWGTNFVTTEFSNLAKILPWGKAPGSFSQGGLQLLSGMESLRAGQRWMEVIAELDSSVSPVEGTRIDITVTTSSSDSSAAVSVPAEDYRALIRVDMRSMGEKNVRLNVAWKDISGNNLGTGEMWLTSEKETPLTTGKRIPVRIDVPEGAETQENLSVRFGMPMPRGALWDERGIILTGENNLRIPSQIEAAGLWSEQGSVKWMWIDALVPPGTETVYVEAGERNVADLPAIPLRLSESGGAVTVDTGTAQYILGKDGALIKTVNHNGRTMATEGSGRGLYVIGQDGRLAKASAEGASMKVESAGPLAAVVRIEGPYMTAEGEELARHITRLNFNAGRAEVTATHTLVLTRDTNQVWFKDVGWEMEVYAGTAPRAVFGISHENPHETMSVPVDELNSVSMTQRQGVGLGLKPARFSVWTWHLRDVPVRDRNPRSIMAPYFHGENVFDIKDNIKGEILHRGGKMGDWAALQGSSGGMMFSCRDAAAQHPKEYEISGNRLNLKLFSSSGGRELDFRMESIMKNWGMVPLENIESYEEVPREVLEENLEIIAGHHTNAAGWSKTHEILLLPVSPAEIPVNSSFLHSRQVFAHVDPQWIRETEAIGSLHPKDKSRFPLEETLIENMFWGKVEEGLGKPKGGFIDYHSGPIWIIHSLRTGSYTLHSDSWHLYARSGERDIRNFAQTANRAWLDGNMFHWDAPGKIKGLFASNTRCAGTQARRTRKADLPLYWEGESTYQLATSANLDQAYLDYYLTGYRRAGDIMENYARAVKENLDKETSHWRVGLTLRHIAQAYEFTWEKRLKELIYEILDLHLYDPEGAILQTKARPYRSSTYKMETDVDALIELWQLFGDNLFRDMSRAAGSHVWETVGFLQYRSTGMPGHFVWEETGCPSMVSGFDFARRRLIADYLKDAETGEVENSCVSRVPRFFKGLPHAMDIMARAYSEKNQPKASWIAFSSDHAPVSVFFIKPEESAFSDGEPAIKVTVRTEDILPANKDNGNEKPRSTGKTVILKPHATVLNRIWVGHDLHTVQEKSSNRFGQGGIINVNIPKDAPPGLYELEITRPGTFSVFLDEQAPLALYAPEGWSPPAMNPPARIYFRTKPSQFPHRIFFEKGALLFTPEGKSFNGGEKVSGWVELPPGMNGLWGFESVDPGLVKTENITPFFSMENPEIHKDSDDFQEPIFSISGHLDWPDTWRVFGPIDRSDEILSGETLASYPEEIKVGTALLKGKDVAVKGTVYDFPETLKGQPTEKTAYVFLKLESEKDQEVTLGMGADWWMQAWVNGIMVHDTTETTNIHFPFSIWNHIVEVPVKEGKNVLAVRFIKGGGSELALGGPEQLRKTPRILTEDEDKSGDLIEDKFNFFLTGDAS